MAGDSGLAGLGEGAAHLTGGQLAGPEEVEHSAAIVACAPLSGLMYQVRVGGPLELLHAVSEAARDESTAFSSERTGVEPRSSAGAEDEPLPADDGALLAAVVPDVAALAESVPAMMPPATTPAPMRDSARAEFFMSNLLISGRDRRPPWGPTVSAAHVTGLGAR